MSDRQIDTYYISARTKILTTVLVSAWIFTTVGGFIACYKYAGNSFLLQLLLFLFGVVIFFVIISKTTNRTKNSFGSEQELYDYLKKKLKASK